MAVDGEKKRKYRKITAYYETEMYKKSVRGEMDEERFWQLQEKLTEWYRNYNPPEEPIYTHYKGNDYLYIGTGNHTETNEKEAIYMDKDGNLHVRPYDMFHGKTEDGQIRFEKRR